MKKQNNLSQEELEDIQLEKAGFTRSEIEKMDKRASDKNTILWKDFLKELEYEI